MVKILFYEASSFILGGLRALSCLWNTLKQQQLAYLTENIL